jgi:hypothetical protein
VVVKDLPALGPALHYESKGTARDNSATVLENVPSGHQRQRRAQDAHCDLFEVEAVPPRAWGKPRSIVLPDEVESATGSSAVDERGGALSRVVRDKGVEITAVPVAGGATKLSLDLAGKAGIFGAGL